MLVTKLPFFFFPFLFSGKRRFKAIRLAALKIHRQEKNVVLLRRLCSAGRDYHGWRSLEGLEFHMTTQFLLDALCSACWR